MKKRFWKWLVPGILALMMILTTVSALADGAYGVATMDKVVVFRQPSTSANVWFRINTGHVCEILDVTTKGETTWYKVNTTHPEPNGHTYIGYVRGTAFRPLTVEETEAYLAGQEVVATAAPTATMQPTTDDALKPTQTPDTGDDTVVDTTIGNTPTTGVGEITADGTNFRLTPSVEGGLIGKLDADVQVELVSIPSQIGEDYWYRVRYNGQEGYIQSMFVRVLTSSATPAPEYSYYGYAKLKYNSANLRDEAGGLTYAQWEGKGSLLQIVGPAEGPVKGYDWYPVYYGAKNKIYYVREDVIDVVNVGGYDPAVPTTAPTAAPTEGVVGSYGYVITTKGGVNLRLWPAGETVAQIKRGTVVPCIGPSVDPEDSSYTWYHVQYEGMRGYLRGDCVRICDENGDDVAVVPTPAPTPAPTYAPVSYGYVKLIKGGVNLRDAAGGTSLTQLPRDLILPVIGAVVPQGVAGRYAWYPVRTADGRTGYVRSDCLIECDAEGNKITGTVTPAPGATPAPTTAPTVSPYGYVQITEAGTNLRDAIGGDTLTQLKKGTVWPLVGLPAYASSETWYPISANGYTGFVRGDCAFKLSATQQESYLAGNGVPVETPAPTPAMSDYVITVMDYVRLRESASKDAAWTYKVRTGTVMPFDGKKDVGTVSWYSITYKGESLWVLGECVEVMTQAEYEAWLGENPSATPVPDAVKGYVKTIKGGVNIRSAKTNGSVVEQVSRGTIMPYYEGPVSGGSYTWYKVKTPKGNAGYVRSEFVDECSADGGDAPVVTPAPGGSTTPSNPQEATYTTLRLGSTGTAVKNLVTELKNQGYYTGDITSSYTTAVQRAVVAFQTAKGLTVDGIAGNQTQHALFGTVPPGTADTNNLTFDFYPVEKIDWYTGGIQQLWAKGANYKIYDVKTGIVWWAHRWSGVAHADIEPLTAADTARLCKIYGVDDAQDIWDNNLWHRRPCLITIGTRTFACSLFGMPHNPDGDTIDNNNMTGQICMHFTNSKGHDSGKVDTYHQEAIQDAYDWAKERFGAK